MQSSNESHFFIMTKKDIKGKNACTTCNEFFKLDCFHHNEHDKGNGSFFLAHVCVSVLPFKSCYRWSIYNNETMNTYEMAQSGKKARLFFRCHKPKRAFLLPLMVANGNNNTKATTIWLKNVWEMKLFSDGACHWQKEHYEPMLQNTYLDKFKWDATKPTIQHSENARK